MTTRAAVLFCLLAGCSGLGLHQQQPWLTKASAPAPSLTGSSSSSSKPWTMSASELANAEEKAELARVAAEEAATASDQIGVPRISAEELAAKDRRAATESASVFKNDEKLGGLLDSMEKQAAVEDKVVGKMMRQSELLRDHKFGKSTAELSKKLDEMEDAEEQDRKATKSAQKDFDSQEKQYETARVMQAKELHKVEKQYETAKARMRADHKKVEAAEAQAAKRLATEAEALRQDARNNGTLSKEDIKRLLDLSEHDFSDLKFQLWRLPNDNNTGAWFDDRMDNLRARSAAASAHMVESIRFKVAEFVSNHKDYSDRQFAPLLGRLLNDARAEIKTMMNSSAAIGQRMQRFEPMVPEKMTHALAMALDGVMTNVEFKNNIFQYDTTRLDHSTGHTACEALFGMAESMQPALRSIGHIKESLDDMSKVVPSILVHQEESRRLMERRTQNLLNMAYMQQLAYKESAEIISSQVVPEVMNRLHCAFSGAPGLSGLLSRTAAAAVALALGWLAQ